MASISDLEVEQVRQHLITGGFLAAFTDIYGNAQPAPVTQMNEIDLVALEDDDRAVMIRTIGGVENPQTRTFFKDQFIMVLVVSKVGVSDSIIANGLADDMEKWLMANPSDGQCMFNIVSNGVTGPSITEDSRRVYEVNFTASFNIDRPVFG